MSIKGREAMVSGHQWREESVIEKCKIKIEKLAWKESVCVGRKQMSFRKLEEELCPDVKGN